jgi:hypothetical protein
MFPLGSRQGAVTDGTLLAETVKKGGSPGFVTQI